MADQDLKFRILASVVGVQSIDGLKKSVDGVNTSSKNLEATFGGVKAALGTLAGAFAIKETVGFLKNIIDTGDELQALSEKTGIGAGSLYGLKTAAELANVPLEGLTGALKKFSVNVVEASNGNKEIAAAYRSLGVSVKDSNGQIRGSDKIILDLADRFSKLKDGPEKAALAVKLFGKQGAELIPFLNQGSEALQKYSLAFGDEFAARADQFNDTLTTLGASLKGNLAQGLNELLPALQDVLNAFSDLPSEAEDTIGIFDGIGEAIRLVIVPINGFVEAFKSGADTIITIGKSLWESLNYIFGQIGDAISTRAQQLKALGSLDFEGAAKLGNDFESRSVSRAKKLGDDIDEIWDKFATRQETRNERLGKSTASLLKNSLIFGEGSVKEIKDRTKKETAPAIKNTAPAPDVSGIGDNGKQWDKENEALGRFILTQQQEIDGRKQDIEMIGLSSVERQKLTEARKIDNEVAKASIGVSKDIADAYQVAGEAIKEQRLALIELEDQQRRSFGAGAREFLTDYARTATDTAAQVKQVFGTAFQGLEDAFTNFVKTGKLNFKDFANAVIDDIIRISIRRAILAPLAGALGSAFGGAPAAFANGGIMTSSGPVPLKSYANGGVANSPQLALFGEGKTAEAYVPLPDGRRIPAVVDLKNAGGKDGGTSVVVNVNMQTGNSETQSSSETGKKLGNLISNAVKNALIEERRPGGLLYG